ncbi:hypothetical protein ACFXG4_08355 [Nocardia sp. NPDC059246]|uniref:hypothetical protein n=1 Tax=unclassified Nocardia TaxID=2637762 RepID=UPI0036CFB8AE
MAVPPIIVAAPAVSPARFGLQSAADQVAENGRIASGIGWEPLPCGPAHTDPALCGDTPTDRELTDGIGFDTADPIVVYAGFTCHAVGISEQQMRDRAAAALATEWVAVEKTVWSETGLRLMSNTVGEQTAVLSATPVSITRGVGLLEAFLGASYGGVGVLHAPRAVAAHAATAQLLGSEPGRLTTPLGNRWAFGSGYPGTGPDGSAAAAGTTWLVVTGAVTYRRTGVTFRPDTMAQAFDRADNTIRSVAERTYVIAWDDCVRAAVPITLT